MKHNDITHPTIKRLLDNHPAQLRESLRNVEYSHANGYTIQRPGERSDSRERYDSQEMTYIINLGEDLYKIGKSGCIAQRFRAFQTSNPFVFDEKSLVALIMKPPELLYGKRHRRYGLLGMRDGSDVERILHDWCIKKGYNLDPLLGDNLKSKKQSEIFKIPIHAFKELFDLVVDSGCVLLDRQIVERLVLHGGTKVIKRQRGVISESR